MWPLHLQCQKYVYILSTSIYFSEFQQCIVQREPPRQKIKLQSPASSLYRGRLKARVSLVSLGPACHADCLAVSLQLTEAVVATEFGQSESPGPWVCSWENHLSLSEEFGFLFGTAECKVLLRALLPFLGQRL